MKYFLVALCTGRRNNRRILIDGLDRGRLVDYVLRNPTVWKILKIKRTL